MHDLDIFTTGGTIDKVYFDALSEFEVGGSALGQILEEANVSLSFAIHELMRKDSLELNEDDRDVIALAVAAADAPAVLVTHGTDTMADTARHLQTRATDKTVVFTGAMQPARLRLTDAIFNVGFAIAAACSLPYGVYLAMNGRIFDPAVVRKDRKAGCFVAMT
ncbi:MAG: asparaginase domain-containing protein [Pseudomonadota bacterium]